MSPVIFGVAFVLGAGALAVWTDFRFPRLAPEELHGILIHTAVSFLTLHVVATMVGPLAGAGPLPALVTVLGFALPVVVYAFVVGIWAIKLFCGAYAGMRH